MGASGGGGDARSATLAWRFATGRLDQNVALYEEMRASPNLLASFSSAWRAWKSIPKKAIMLRGHRWLRLPLRICTKLFYTIVYRLGDYALEDWSVLRPLLPAMLPAAPKQVVLYAEHLRRGYLRCVLKTAVYTLQLYGPAQEHHFALVPADVKEEPTGFLIFQVLDMNPAAKKTIRTTTSVLDPSGPSAMQLQFFRRVATA